MTKEPPKGPIKWMRRRLLPAGAKLCALAGLVILVLWVVGRVLTDQFAWSQYLWWAPPIWAIGSAWGLLIVSALLGKLSLRTGGMILRPVLMLACVGCSLFLVFGIWRMHRAVLGSPSTQQSSLRILHWNQSAYKAWDQEGPTDKPEASPAILPLDADVVLVVNSRRNRHRITFVRELAAEMAPSEEEYRVSAGIKAHFQPDHFTVQGEALVASRLPILRTGTAWLSTDPNPETTTRTGGQRGWVMFIELDLREKHPGGPASMVIWLVDLPSEPTLWRMTSMQTAVDAVNRWNGTQRISNGTGKWDPYSTDNPFPEPDVVIGDFNTLRGSASLNKLAPSMRDAFAQSGHGRARSWIPRVHNKLLRQPTRLADWHIDLAMTGHRWRAHNYRLIDPPVGPHKMQVVDLVPAGE